MHPLRKFLVAIAALLVPAVAIACMWDYDTIRMERARFPGTLELITGKFLRHSPEFYQWRIENRLKRLESDPTNAALLDDLAVAYDKTGQHEKAIETALKTETIHPDRYETASNLGTFYFHAGRPREGLPYIVRALKINPNAHFGREKYQLMLTEYVLKQQDQAPVSLPLLGTWYTFKWRDGDEIKLPLAEVTFKRETSESSPSVRRVTLGHTFYHYLYHNKQTTSVEREQLPDAVKAVLGMMKFAKHDSPILLEALGNLLTQQYEGNPTTDAKLLAARAYLKASYAVPNGPIQMAYRGMAVNALNMQTIRTSQTQVSLEQVEQDFQKELSEGEKWYAVLREKELSWIRDGIDPEAEFDKLYDVEPVASGMDVKDPMSYVDKMTVLFVVGVIVCCIFVLACLWGAFVLIRRDMRRRAAATQIARQPDAPSPPS
ncbi:MAG: hypothetical protein K8T89_20925 [Planctomycetes bacterium]|nr:hypothetical protein [Planctomycetota bacterium]